MNKTLVYGIAGGLLGALSGVVVNKGIEVFKEAKKAVMDEIERARGAANPVDITPAFQEVFREDNEYGGYTISKSEEHKNVYLFDFESMHPEIDIEQTVTNPELRYEETDDLNFDDLDISEDDIPNIQTWKENREWHARFKDAIGERLSKDYRNTLHMYVAISDDKEVLEDVRYDINSVEALQQYKAMRLADIQRGEYWDILYRFFNVIYEPVNDMDENVRISIEAEREEFFGLESIHTIGQATIAEVILHFAELMSLDFGESADHFAEELVNNLCIRRDDAPSEYDKVGYYLTNHELFTRKGFGLFGLTNVQMGQMERQTFFEEYNRSSYFDDFD